MPARRPGAVAVRCCPRRPWSWIACACVWARAGARGVRHRAPDAVNRALHYNYFRSYSPASGRYTQGDPIGLNGGWNRFGYVDGNALGDTDPLGLMGGGSPQGRARGAPNVNSFGCMGLACVTGGMEPASMSAELSFGGGIEICDPSPLRLNRQFAQGTTRTSKCNLLAFPCQRAERRG